MASSDHHLIRRALGRDDEALDALIDRLLPVIRARVGRALRKGGGRIGAHDADDLTQEIWVALIADEGRLLLAYDAERGMSLEGYVGLIAEREIGNIRQKALTKKRGGDLKIVAEEESTAASPLASPEEHAVTRDLAVRLSDHLDGQLPLRGRLVLRFAFDDGCAPTEVAEHLGVSLQVVYNWQHKIRALAKAFLG